MIGKDVSTKYNLRTLAMYQKIATYIRNFISAKKGNYLVFFPSYRMMQEVEQELELVPFETPIQLFSQKMSMKEQERESFLEHFQLKTRHKQRLDFVLWVVSSEKGST